MKRTSSLVLLLSLFALALSLQESNAQMKNDSNLRFKISKNGMEVAEYKKVVLVTELDEYSDVTLGVSKLGLTEAMIRKECESRMREAGLEALSGFTRPEHLSVKVSIKYRSYYISIQFNRPVSYQVEETLFTRYGAVTWQKSIHGQHGYTPEYILENLGVLFDEFIKEYVNANSK